MSREFFRVSTDLAGRHPSLAARFADLSTEFRVALHANSHDKD